MKKNLIFGVIISILLMPQYVLASPNASINTNASSIENGQSVTATVVLTDTAAWNIKIQGSGAATCSTKEADVTSDAKSTTKTFNLSCTAVSEGTITFKVVGDITNGAGETRDISLTKNVSVVRAKSSDNGLKDLKVDGITLPGFSASKASYTLDNSGTNINITGIANDSKATISGLGNKNLNYGNNYFNIIVTAENGNKKTYTIIVNKPDSRSANNNLKSLSVDKGKIDFNKNITSYSINLEHNVNEINITAKQEDSKATIAGTGIKVLNDYINEFNIVVTAENGSQKVYTIKALRKDENGNYKKLSDDNSVNSISIKDYEFNFNKDIKKYNILVENVNELEINVVPNDNNAKVEIQNNKNLKPGLNIISIKIIAENNSTNEYIFNVYKIGDDEKQVNASTKKTASCQKKAPNNKNNIWIFISIIELLIIISILLFKKIKSKISNKNIINTPTVNNKISVESNNANNVIDNQPQISDNSPSLTQIDNLSNTQSQDDNNTTI